MSAHPARRILFAGALDDEIRPLRHRLRDVRSMGPYLLVGHRNGWEVGLTRIGVGKEKAERHVRATLAEWDAGWVVSVGTCGALADELWLGQVVTARAVLGVPPERVRVLPVLRPVNLVTVDREVDTPEVRSELAARGAQVVEMEALGVLAAAEDRIFSAVKVVSDHAGRPLPGLPSLPRPPDPVRNRLFKGKARVLAHVGLAPSLASFLDANPPRT